MTKKITRWLFLALFILSGSQASIAWAEEGTSVFYTHVNWTEHYAPSHAISHTLHSELVGWIWVHGGKIAATGRGELPEDLKAIPQAKIIDLEGGYAEPGYIDAQANLLREGLTELKDPNSENWDPAQAWKITETLDANITTQAILLAQTTRLSQGITSIQDETLDPAVGAKYRQLEDLGILKLRVWIRSYGPQTRIRSWMQSIAGSFSNFDGEKKLHYYGEQFFHSENYSDQEIENIYLFGGSVGIAFEVVSTDEALRIAKIHAKIRHRRSALASDVVKGPFTLNEVQENILEQSGIYWVKDPKNPSIFAPEVGEFLGRIAQGYDADLVFYRITPTSDGGSPEKVIEQTLIHGEIVYEKSKDALTYDQLIEKSQVSASKRFPHGSAIIPLVGYDSSIGFLAGIAYFTYPYSLKGSSFTARGVVAPFSGRGLIDVEWASQPGQQGFAPKIGLRANSLSTRYFGFGNSTSTVNPVVTQPLRFDALPSLTYRIQPRMDLLLTALVTSLHEGQSGGIQALSQQTEGDIDGMYAGARLEWVWDERDNPFSARYGGRRMIWTESWFVQANAGQFVQKVGFSISQFFPLLAPSFVLATRIEGSSLFGSRSYLTAVSLGGPLASRGYFLNRFRGNQSASATVEMRYPIWRYVSGAVFAEVGRVWASDDPIAQNTFWGLHPTLGLGLRFGIPPDFLVKSRLDVGFGLDQIGFYFTFNEAF